MTLRILSLGAAMAALLAASFAPSVADAQSERRANRNSSANSSYMDGPRTRVFVTKRSWLDAGTEVIPGERKFSDYAFPPTQNIDQLNSQLDFRRRPLNTPSDLGGYPERFPLY